MLTLVIKVYIKQELNPEETAINIWSEAIGIPILKILKFLPGWEMIYHVSTMFMGYKKGHNMADMIIEFPYLGDYGAQVAQEIISGFEYHSRWFPNDYSVLFLGVNGWPVHSGTINKPDSS